MADECSNCDYARPRMYGTKSVTECRVREPFREGQKGQWPEVAPTDWCGEYKIIGASDPASYSVQGLTLNTTTKTKIAEYPGYLLWVYNVDVTNTSANKGVMVKFFDGNTNDIIGIASIAANQSSGKTMVPPAKAGTGEVWAQLDSSGFDVYVYLNTKKGAPVAPTQTGG